MPPAYEDISNIEQVIKVVFLKIAFAAQIVYKLYTCRDAITVRYLVIVHTQIKWVVVQFPFKFQTWYSVWVTI